MLATLICHFLPATRHRRRARTEASILAVLEASPNGLSGAEIQKATGIGSGPLYPALTRMTVSGVLTSRWANEPKPRRRIYRKAEGRS